MKERGERRGRRGFDDSGEELEMNRRKDVAAQVNSPSSARVPDNQTLRARSTSKHGPEQDKSQTQRGERIWSCLAL